MTALAFLIITSVIGAGFSTGAELLTFFGNTSIHPALIGALVAVFLFIIIASLTFFGSGGAKRFFVPICFVMLTAMTAGAGAIGGVWGAPVTLILAALVVCFGFEKMLWVNKYLTIFIIVFLLIVCIPNYTPAPPQKTEPNAAGTFFSALLYAGMNCCMLETVVIKARRKFSLRKILMAAALGSATVGVLVFVVLGAVRNITDEMPILALSNNLLTTIVILTCICSSQYVCLFNIQEQTQSNIVIICLAAWCFSFLGFVEILGTFYPVIGGCMVLYIIWISCSRLYFFLRARASHRKSPRRGRVHPRA